MATEKTTVKPTFSIPGISVMDRYIFLELLFPFLFGMGLFTSLGMSVGILFDLVRKVTEAGLGFNIALQVFLLKMPSFIVLAFPMSMLLASLMAYSRLSSDSELIALRSIGVNIYRIVIPAIVFSLLASGMTFFFNDVVSPSANYQSNVILNNALQKGNPGFKERNIIYPEFGSKETDTGQKEETLTRLFYAESFDGETMHNLTILDRSQEGFSQIVTANSAIWNITQNTWDFFVGTIYLIAPDGSYDKILRFDHQQLSLPRTPLDMAQQQRDYPEMSIAQSKAMLKVIRLTGDEKKVRKLEVRIQEKYALPFVCLVFGLVGSALGVRPQNTSKATSFGICVLVVFCYYLFAFLSSSLGVSGVFTPIMSAWTPNVLGISAGVYLLFRSAH